MAKKTNKEYNRERKAIADFMKRDLKRDKALEKMYLESYQRIQNQIDKLYMDYAGANGLSKADVIKQAKAMDVERFGEFAKQAVRNKDFTPKTNRVLKLYNLKMKVSRLELTQAQVELETHSLIDKANGLFDIERYRELELEYKRQAGILGMSVNDVPKRYKQILDADFYGQNFSSRVWGKNGLQDTMQRELFGSISRIYTDMDGYKRERRRLSDLFNTSQSNAERLLKTELSRIRTNTAYNMLTENGFTHIIYIAEPGACSTCAPLDGMAIPIEEAVTGENMSPMHPRCRCHFIGQIKLKRKDGTSNLDEWGDWEEYQKGK